MKQNVIMYGEHFDTTYVFMHVLARVLSHHSEYASDFHFHVILDDRRDLDLARSLLLEDKISIHLQYQEIDPFNKNRRWPSQTIQEWERKYGNPNLKVYSDKERTLEGCSEDLKWKYLLSHVEYFERLYQEIQPVLYVSGAADALPTWVGLEIFRRNDTSVLSFSPSRFGYKSFIADNPYEILNIGQTYRELRRKGLSAEERRTARDLLDQYRVKRIRPASNVELHASLQRLLPRPSRTWQVLRDSWRSDAKYYDLPFSKCVTRSLAARRTWFHNLYLKRRTIRGIPDRVKYFFFPLHYEPEMAIITKGRGWTNQVRLIRLISDALPTDRWLYVKEHPSMLTGYRPLRFYRVIMSLPRVKLLDQRVNSYDIVSNAEAVLTISGTVGWEALMLGKPVGLFGHCFYEEFSEGVNVVDRPEDLPQILLNLRHRQYSEEDLLAYITAVLSKTRDGVFIDPRFYPQAKDLVLSEENLDNIARVIIEHLVKVDPKSQKGNASATTR